MGKPILEARKIRKSFAGVAVLDDVDFTLAPGQVHALIGQNGAGKSTLMKIINGVYQKDSGVVRIDGKEVSLKDPLDARQAGISMVFQEFSLVPTMTVAHNVFLSREPKKNGVFIDDRKIEQNTRELLASIGVDVDINPRAYVDDLGVGARQLTEIAKALSYEPRILILDEPTASLSSAEIESLFRVIARLKQRGISIIYISHYLQDIFKICDSLTVLRDGQVVLSAAVEETTIDEVIDAMIGRKLEGTQAFQGRSIDRSAKPLLEVNGLATEKIQDVSFKLWPKEILGLAGLLGSGRTEIFRAMFGIDRIVNGNVKIGGRLVRIRSSKDAINNGISLIPEDRRNQGLILDFSVKENLLLPILRRLVRLLLISDKKGRKIVYTFVKDFNIKIKSLDQEVKFLSGGNQQKVVVAKSMASESKILLLDDPTFGIDINSKQEIMEIIRNFVDQGNGAILVSSEFGELATYCDRILVINKRRIAATVNPKEHTLSEEILLKMVQ